MSVLRRGRSKEERFVSYCLRLAGSERVKTGPTILTDTALACRKEAAPANGPGRAHEGAGHACKRERRMPPQTVCLSERVPVAYFKKPSNFFLNLLTRRRGPRGRGRRPSRLGACSGRYRAAASAFCSVSRMSFELRAIGHHDGDLMIIGMDVFFHDLFPLRVHMRLVSVPLSLLYRRNEMMTSSSVIALPYSGNSVAHVNAVSVICDLPRHC